MVKIKICGLRQEKDIDIVNQFEPDYIGFILTPGFKRSIDESTAQKLKTKLKSSIKTVGVFVNDDIDKINNLVKKSIIDIVQLHGDESTEYCRKINAPVIKMLKPDTFCKADDYKNYVDFLLFDSGSGTGKPFDWNTLPKTDKTFFLAGGLNADNIKQAIKEIKPYAVDMSSSVEINSIKDYNKIKQIMEIVRYE